MIYHMFPFLLAIFSNPNSVSPPWRWMDIKHCRHESFDSMITDELPIILFRIKYFSENDINLFQILIASGFLCLIFPWLAIVVTTYYLIVIFHFILLLQVLLFSICVTITPDFYAFLDPATNMMIKVVILVVP